MDNRTKLILSAVGISAIVIPAVLLVVLTSRTGEQPQVSSTPRQIDTRAIEDKVKTKSSQEMIFPTPTPATPSAKVTPEGSPSAHSRRPVVNAHRDHDAETAVRPARKEDRRAAPADAAQTAAPGNHRG